MKEMKEMKEMKIEEDGKTLNVSQGLSFWVWDWTHEDKPENKNTFVVDSVNTPHIHFDQIPMLIEWLKGLEKFRTCEHEPKRWCHPNCPDTFEMVCYHCNCKLKATWSEVGKC